MLVADFACYEVVPHVRGDAVARRYPDGVWSEVVRKAGKPDCDGEHAHGEKSDTECMCEDDVAPLGELPGSRRKAQEMKRRQEHRQPPGTRKQLAKYTGKPQHQRSRSHRRQNREHGGILWRADDGCQLASVSDDFA